MPGYDDICCFSGHRSSPKMKVLWEITNRCNLNCSFCHRTKGLYSECSYEQAINILSVLYDVGVSKIIFSGGEPFCRSDIIEILKEAKQREFEIDMCTNATLFNQKDISVLSKLLSEVSVSVDSCVETIHDNLRGCVGAWEKSVNNICNMVNAGIEVHVISIVDDLSIPYIRKTVGFLKEIGVHSVSFIGKIPIGKGFNPLLIDKHQVLLRELFDSIRDDYPGFPVNTKQIFADNEPNCFAGTFTFGLSSNGLLYPCILQRNIEGVNIHSSNLDTIQKIFNGSYVWKQKYFASGEGLCTGSKIVNTKLGGSS